ncbi:hypothetical protein ACA910_012893 [Epithemia clementina (nom. ined.)]
MTEAPDRNAEELSGNDRKTTVSEKSVRPSIAVRLIRHAESANNSMYRDARYIYRGGTPEFDEEGWYQYVDKHRSADPHISDTGKKQAQYLAAHLVPHLSNQASQPVRIITSPMRRTLDTIRPTLHGLAKANTPASVVVNGFYHESEGCHTKDKPEEGLNPMQIKQFLESTDDDDSGKRDDMEPSKLYSSLDFVGFPSDHTKGWYYGAKGEETRAASEERAAKFYLWLCEYLDEQLRSSTVTGDGVDDVFDAGVAIPGEEDEDEHDRMACRKRKRRTCLLVGHGDFMSLVLKRIVAGFGHYVEQKGSPHRSAFVHFNTGMTELEYFGFGRFLLMGQNLTPHLRDAGSSLLTGGSLKDGWSYLVPAEPLNSEVKVAFDDDLDEHVLEQTQALKALYLKSESIPVVNGDSSLQVEEQKLKEKNRNSPKNAKHFIVHRGLRVVGCATYQEDTGFLTDVAIRPSAGPNVLETLLQAVKSHTKSVGRSGSFLVFPRAGKHNKELFEQMGFKAVDDDDEKDTSLMEMKH